MPDFFILSGMFPPPQIYRPVEALKKANKENIFKMEIKGYLITYCCTRKSDNKKIYISWN